eukprot:10823540-Ditylum_brightwellii.AAC.1
MGTYILDGLNPSPQITYKMRTQSVDKVQGNDFIAQNIGTNAELKYKIFHHFFVVQNPITTPPPKDKCPNYKVDSFFDGWDTWLGLAEYEKIYVAASRRIEKKLLNRILEKKEFSVLY